MKEWMDHRGNPIDWTNIRGIIFDVDGTLYHQQPVRLHMGCSLAARLLRHPSFFRDLIGIYYFRKLRETELFRTQPLEAQIREAAIQSKIHNPRHLKSVIQRWMFDAPLPFIRMHQNHDVLSLFKQMQAEGKRILIYSDYAPEQKLETLGIKADGIYYPGIGGIEGLKPSGYNVRLILNEQNLRPQETVYIGDRPEKDGESAIDAGVLFIPVR